jgi:hypothetical protein
LYLSHSAKSPSAHPGEYPDSSRDVAYLLFKSPGENRGFFIFRVPGSGCQAVRTTTAPPPAGTFGPAVPLLGKEGITLPTQVLQNVKTHHGQLNTPPPGIRITRSQRVATPLMLLNPSRVRPGTWQLATGTFPFLRAWLSLSHLPVSTSGHPN